MTTRTGDLPATARARLDWSDAVQPGLGPSGIACGAGRGGRRCDRLASLYGDYPLPRPDLLSGEPLVASGPAAGDPRDLRVLPHRRRHRRPFLGPRRRCQRARRLGAAARGSDASRCGRFRGRARPIRGAGGARPGPHHGRTDGSRAVPICHMGRARPLLLSRSGNSRSHGGANSRLPRTRRRCHTRSSSALPCS